MSDESPKKRSVKRVKLEVVETPTSHHQQETQDGLTTSGASWLKDIGFKQQLEQKINVLAAQYRESQIIVTVKLA